MHNLTRVACFSLTLCGRDAFLVLFPFGSADDSTGRDRCNSLENAFLSQPFSRSVDTSMRHGLRIGRNHVSTKAMINNIRSTGVHAANIAASGQHRAKKAEPAQDTTVETGKTPKPAHPAHPKGHIPPGLARAAENIASKIFSRADADASGTVTQEELSAVHSRHARTLASSDLFQGLAEVAASTTVEISADPTGATSDSATDAASDAVADPKEIPTNAPTQAGVTEAQLKAALAKFFYAKIGITWTPPAPAIAEEPVPVFFALAIGLASITGVFTTAGAAASTCSAAAFAGTGAALATASIFSSTLVTSATSKLLCCNAQ
jgi:hypothetical protein